MSDTPIQSQAVEWDAQVPRGDESGIPHPQGDVNRPGNKSPKVPAQGLYSRRLPPLNSILPIRNTEASDPTPTPDPDPTPAVVYLLAGQSNMRGSGLTASLSAPESEPLPTVYYFQCNEYAKASEEPTWVFDPDGDFVTLEPGLKWRTPEYFGPELSFGHAMRSYIDSDTAIYLVEYSEGSTNLYEDWNTETPAGKLTWARFESVYDNAIVKLDALNITYEIGGFLWFQGESDALKNDDGTWAAAHNAILTALIAKVRDITSEPTLPVAIARIVLDIPLGTYNKPAGASATIQTAQVAVANADDNAEWIDTVDLSHNAVEAASVHLDTQGYLDFGERCADWLETGTYSQAFEAWAFDGTDSESVVNRVAECMDFPDDFWAVGGWFKLNNNIGDTFQWLIGYGGSGEPNSLNMFIRDHANGTPDTLTVTFIDKLGSASPPATDIGDPLALPGWSTDWQHVLVVRNEAILTVYIDGVSRKVLDVTGFGILDAQGQMSFGSNEDKTAGWLLKGAMRRWFKVNKVPTDDQIIALAEKVDGVPTDTFTPDELTGGIDYATEWYIPMSEATRVLTAEKVDTDRRMNATNTLITEYGA